MSVDILLDSHRKFLAFLEKRVGDRAAAEDILQDAFVRNLEKTPDIEPGALVPWFYTVLRNAAIDRHRRDQTHNRRLEEFAHELQRERDVAGDADREICACISRLAATLKPEYGNALERIDIGGASLKDYASEVGVTPNNAGVRVHRARQALRLRLMESCGICAEHGCVDCTCATRPGAAAPL